MFIETLQRGPHHSPVTTTGRHAFRKVQAHRASEPLYFQTHLDYDRLWVDFLKGQMKTKHMGRG